MNSADKKIKEINMRHIFESKDVGKCDNLLDFSGEVYRFNQYLSKFGNAKVVTNPIDLFVTEMEKLGSKYGFLNSTFGSLKNAQSAPAKSLGNIFTNDTIDGIEDMKVSDFLKKFQSFDFPEIPYMTLYKDRKDFKEGYVRFGTDIIDNPKTVCDANVINLAAITLDRNAIMFLLNSYYGWYIFGYSRGGSVFVNDFIKKNSDDLFFELEERKSNPALLEAIKTWATPFEQLKDLSQEELDGIKAAKRHENSWQGKYVRQVNAERAIAKADRDAWDAKHKKRR